MTQKVFWGMPGVRDRVPTGAKMIDKGIWYIWDGSVWQRVPSDEVIITESLAQVGTVHMYGGAGGGFYDGPTHPARSDRAGGGPG